jgi:hypothetical protein
MALPAGPGPIGSGGGGFLNAVSPVPSPYSDPAQLAPSQQLAHRTAKVYNQLLESLIAYNGTGDPHKQRPAVGPVPILFYAPGSKANAAALLGGMIGPTEATSSGTGGATSGGVTGDKSLRRLVSILLMELLRKLYAQHSTATSGSTGMAGAAGGIGGYNATGTPAANTPALGSLINVVNAG